MFFGAPMVPDTAQTDMIRADLKKIMWMIGFFAILKIVAGDPMDAFFDLFVCLFIWLSYYQKNYCYSLILIILFMTRIFTEILIIGTYAQNGDSLLGYEPEKWQKIMRVALGGVLILFYVYVIYHLFQSYKEYKAGLLEAGPEILAGRRPMAGGASEPNYGSINNQEQDYGSGGGMGGGYSAGMGGYAGTSSTQTQSRPGGFVPFSGQGRQIGGD